jgi:hypothetical protein
MKTCALYGFISTLAGAFLVLILYFAGFHSDPSKLGAAQAIASIGGLAIAVTCTALGMRARREETPAAEEFGYGATLGAGVLIALVGSVLGAIFTYAYHAFINPGFSEILIQDAVTKMEAKGVSGAQLDKIESFDRILFSPVGMAVSALVIGFIFGVIISLIVAAFVKRPAPSQPPAV